MKLGKSIHEWTLLNKCSRLEVKGQGHSETNQPFASTTMG